MTDYYLNPHSSQYQSGASPFTRHYGCTWTSGANGVDATTAGRLHPTPDQVHQLLPRRAETNPTTGGWSLPDLVKALGRMGVVLENLTGQGWSGVRTALGSGRYVVLQGVSAEFANSTCSGAFDGDHAIGVHPRSKDEDGESWHWIDDPICQTGRWERDAVLRRYAEALNPRVYFAAFADAVPAAVPPKPVRKPVLRHGARALKAPVAKRVRVRRGHRANVRTAPRLTARIARREPRNARFTAWQVAVKDGTRWYGNRLGTRWVHAGNF